MKMKYLPLLLLFILSGCARIKSPEFRRIENFHLKNLELQQAVIGFDLTYFNPNNFGVTVKDAVADVYVDSVYLGKFVQDSSVDVYKTSNFSIPFSGNISLQTALNLKPGKLSQNKILITANGSVKLGKAGIYITKDIRYQGKHSIEEINFFH